MAPDVPKIDPDRHPRLGDAAWNFRDEVFRWLLHGHSLSDPRDLLIPFFGNSALKLPQTPYAGSYVAEDVGSYGDIQGLLEGPDRPKRK